MKKAILLLIPLFLVSVLGCSTSQSTVDIEGLNVENEIPNNAVPNQIGYYRNLVDFLYRVPGVQVDGPASNPIITIRGVSTFISGVEPLYVIDGLVAGNNYSNVNSMLNVRDISHVQVLKGGDAGLYGVRGANGVVVITTLAYHSKLERNR